MRTKIDCLINYAMTWLRDKYLDDLPTNVDFKIKIKDDFTKIKFTQYAISVFVDNEIQFSFEITERID